MSTFFIGAILVVFIIAATINLLRKKKSGGCGGSCDGCSGCPRQEDNPTNF